jgi:hypothetical protein
MSRTGVTTFGLVSATGRWPRSRPLRCRLGSAAWRTVAWPRRPPLVPWPCCAPSSRSPWLMPGPPQRGANCPAADQRSRQAGRAGAHARRVGGVDGSMPGPIPGCCAGPGPGGAAPGRTGWPPGRRPGICAWSWPAAESRGAGERGRRCAVRGHAEEPPGPDGAAGGRANADRRSVERRQRAGGLAVRCAGWRAAAGVELETVGRLEGGQDRSRCPGCTRSRSAPHRGIAVAGRWRGPEGGAASAGARHRRDDDGPLWAPGRCQLVAGCPADRGTTGASAYQRGLFEWKTSQARMRKILRS